MIRGHIVRVSTAIFDAANLCFFFFLLFKIFGLLALYYTPFIPGAGIKGVCFLWTDYELWVKVSGKQAKTLGNNKMIPRV